MDVGSVVDALDGATLTAGRDGRDRAVVRVDAAATGDDLRKATAGALIVTPTSTLVAADDPAELVAHWDAAGVAGLTVWLDDVDALPDALVRAAEQHGFPVITLASHTTIGDVGNAALDAAIQLARAASIAEAQDRFAALSLEELISGHGPSVDDAIERAITFGWDLRRPRAVLLASIDPPEAGAIPSGALDTIAAAARATLGRDAIVWTRSATIAALVAPRTEAPAERREIAERLRRELDERLRSVNVSIGVGRRVDAPELLSRSFAEASRAVEVGRWAKGRHVTEVFDELGLERLLASTPVEELAGFVEHTIGPLLAHDRAQGTDLVDTLARWLETRNTAEAARRMFVHYNTLKNRLDRIEAIIGPIRDDAIRALECEVAVYIAQRHAAKWQTAG